MVDSFDKLTSLATAGAVIDAIGGTSATAKLTGSSDASVSNWRAAGRLPPGYFLIHSAALARLGFEAPPSLWSIQAVPGELQS